MGLEQAIFQNNLLKLRKNKLLENKMKARMAKLLLKFNFTE